MKHERNVMHCATIAQWTPDSTYSIFLATIQLTDRPMKLYNNNEWNERNKNIIHNFHFHFVLVFLFCSLVYAFVIIVSLLLSNLLQLRAMVVIQKCNNYFHWARSEKKICLIVSETLLNYAGSSLWHFLKLDQWMMNEFSEMTGVHSLSMHCMRAHVCLLH